MTKLPLIRSPHLLLALSSHGFGHLSQAAPVINQLRALIPDLRVTVRGKFPEEQIRRRIREPDAIEQYADDFGMVMHHALSVDSQASFAAYAQAHIDWEEKVATLAAHLQAIHVDLVLSDIPYLTLAAARHAGIPAIALCSLNWTDILEHYLNTDLLCSEHIESHPELSIHAGLIDTIRRAYQSANYFLQPAPSMAMPWLNNTIAIGPVCTPGQNRRDALQSKTGLPQDACLVLVGMGGMDYPLTLEYWPTHINNTPVYYLVPEEMLIVSVNTISIDQTGLTYSDLVASVDLIITKPGYGMFVEAAAAGVPVLYVQRPGWPETEALTSWLKAVARCEEISSEALQQGLFKEQLTGLLTQGAYPPVPPSGNLQAATLLQRMLPHTDAIRVD